MIRGYLCLFAGVKLEMEILGPVGGICQPEASQKRDLAWPFHFLNCSIFRSFS